MNVSTSPDIEPMVVPESVLSNDAPGKRRDFTVNTACGLLKLVDPKNVRSGITRLMCVNLSPSPMAIEADSMKDVIADPSSSNPISWLKMY